MAIINLGCGLKPMTGEGVINHDISFHSDHVDVAFDLNEMPWGFNDNIATDIYAIDVFEHLIPDLVQVLNECHRILKPSGLLHLKYPLYTSSRIHDDPTHKWFWSDHVVDYFDDSTDYGKRYGFYTKLRWSIETKHLHKDLSCHVTMRAIK